YKATDYLLLGRESAGAPEEVHRAADARARIAMPGGGRSLNVAIAAGIALAEAGRQLASGARSG
ncbi:MAG: TrmH family RNA methyltransferase, partial [Pseudomonadota bacterium]